MRKRKIYFLMTHMMNRRNLGQAKLYNRIKTEAEINSKGDRIKQHHYFHLS